MPSARSLRSPRKMASIDGISAIVAIDGGARSPLWRSILASVIGVPVIEGGARSGTALGSAFLAALGTGAATSFKDISAWTETLAQTSPNSPRPGSLPPPLPGFQGLYAKLSEDFHVLSRFSN